MGKAKTIEFNSIPFRIEFTSREVIDKRCAEIFDDDKISFGITDYIAQDILIRSDLGKIVARRTLIHELTHVFLFAMGVNLTDEEEVCDFVGAQADSLVELANIVMEECYSDEVE